jgi:gliding motility-associated-like protein
MLALVIAFVLLIYPEKLLAQAQTVNSGDLTTPINLSGTGCTYRWINKTPGAGLAAGGIGNVPAFKAINNGLTPITVTISAKPIITGFAYVTQNSGSVIVINTGTRAIKDVIPAGTYPYGITISPDGSRVYASNIGSASITVINTTTNQVVKTIPVGSNPAGAAVSPDGTRLYVANNGSNTVSVINTINNTVINTLTVGRHPNGVAISPDGKTLYVGNVFSASVMVIDLVTNTITKEIPNILNAGIIALTPDGSKLYVGEAPTITVISTVTNSVINTITCPQTIIGLAITTDGKKLYASGNPLVNSEVYVIDIASDKIIQAITVGSAMEGLSVSPDGGQVYASVYGSDEIAVIDTEIGEVIDHIHTGVGTVTNGNFFLPGQTCIGPTVEYTIKINPGSTIVAGAVSGNINACEGTTSVSPNIQQFTVSDQYLTGNLTATAPPGFEVSLSADGIYGNTVTLPQTGGAASGVVYVRSASTAIGGTISGNVILSTPGTINNSVAVNGIVNALPITNLPSNQVTANGWATLPVKFTGSDNTIFSWTNDTPGIGLPIAGTGIIPAFKAINTSGTPLMARFTVTPISALTGCKGVAQTFSYIITPSFQIPNTFTPNGDGINDIWAVSYLNFYPKAEIKIFNRQGQKLYQANTQTWDGTYKGKNLPVGIYYYVIDLKIGLPLLAGSITIIR